MLRRGMADELFRVEPEPDEPATVLYQHTVLAQTCLPYRNPGDECRVWDRANGAVRLRLTAGSALHPETGEWVSLGLPYGPKPRLILAHLNAEALRTNSPVIHVEASLSAFVRRLGLCREGRTIRVVKDQLARLATAEVRLAVAYGEGEARQVQAHIVSEFDLWLLKDERQRVLWPGSVTLDPRYFTSLTKHAVPLHERALAALAHSAMALDVYAWLSQRLCRVDDPARPAFVPWNALKAQFGQDYGRMDNFKRVFRQTLNLVLCQYRSARIDADDRGLLLRPSPPPIKGRTALIRRP